jgi:alkylation response protein AidB-like acyl-CoA dehydrogenase
MARQRTATSLQLPLPRALNAFRDDTRRFLTEHVTPVLVRDRIDAPSGHDDGTWAAACALEWPAMLVPVTQGGAGGGLLETAVLLEELGRSLAPVPMLSTGVLAALALVHGGADPIAGRTAYAHVLRRCEVGLVDGALSGTLRHVVDGGEAAVVLAVAGDRLVAFDPRDAGVTVEREGSIDPTRRAVTLVLDRVPARVVGARPDAAAAPIATLVAAEAVGGARRCLELSVEWATIREQFGRPIGTFQAISHRCADMLVAVECATAAVRLAARTGDAGSPDHPAAAALALRTALAAYRTLADGTMQVLGGTGYTWDHDVHLHQKRAKGSATLFEQL